MSAILWYVHDHGRCHLDRARAVLAHIAAPVVFAVGPDGGAERVTIDYLDANGQGTFLRADAAGGGG